MSMTSSLNNPGAVEVEDTGMAWPAILGGTTAAVAFLLLLAPLGAGLGISGSSPWQQDGAHKAFALASAVWLIVVQWLSSGIGGYLTGRLRTAWPGAHTHEVFFRDTVHGFLTWALTTIIAFVVLAAGLAHMAERHAGPPGAPPEAYAVSQLLRGDQAPSSATEQDRVDSGLVLMQVHKEGKISDADKAYLSRLVESRTGLAASDAEKRVDDVLAEVDGTNASMHKNTATAMVFVFLSLWIGAFIASAAGALGGLHRDSHYKTGTLNG